MNATKFTGCPMCRENNPYAAYRSLPSLRNYCLVTYSSFARFPGTHPEDLCQQSVTEVNQKISNCFSRYSVHGLQYALPYFDKHSDLDNLCKWKASIMECLTKVIQPCSASITHMLYNVNNFKLVIWSLCEDKEYSFFAYRNCSSQIKKKSIDCFKDLKLKSRRILENGDGNLKTVLCRTYYEMGECLSLSSDESCSNTHTRLLNGIFDTLYNLPGCTEAMSTYADLESIGDEQYFDKTTFTSWRKYYNPSQAVGSQNRLREGVGESSFPMSETPRTPVEKSCLSQVDLPYALLALMMLFTWIY